MVAFAVLERLTLLKTFCAIKSARRDDQDILDDLVRWDAVDASHVNEVAILGLADLVQPMAESTSHGPNPDRDLKLLREMSTQFLGQISGPRRKDVDVLCHP